MGVGLAVNTIDIQLPASELSLSLGLMFKAEETLPISSVENWIIHLIKYLVIGQNYITKTQTNKR